MNPCSDCPNTDNGGECALWRACPDYLAWCRWRVDWEREADPQPVRRTTVRVIEKGEYDER